MEPYVIIDPGEELNVWRFLNDRQRQPIKDLVREHGFATDRVHRVEFYDFGEAKTMHVHTCGCPRAAHYKGDHDAKEKSVVVLDGWPIQIDQIHNREEVQS